MSLVILPSDLAKTGEKNNCVRGYGKKHDNYRVARPTRSPLWPLLWTVSAAPSPTSLRESALGGAHARDAGSPRPRPASATPIAEARAHARDAGLLGSAPLTACWAARALPCRLVIGAALQCRVRPPSAPPTCMPRTGSGRAAAPEGDKDGAGKLFNVLPQPVLVSGRYALLASPCPSFFSYSHLELISGLFGIWDVSGRQVHSLQPFGI